MKITKIAVAGALSFFGLLGLSSCNSTDEPVEQAEVVLFTSITDFNDDNYWTGCYDEAVGDVRVDGFSFSHEASSFTYDGVTYTSWKGFCPSRVNDTQEYADDWTNHQWACMTANPMGGIYMVGNSDSVVKDNPLDNDVCSVQMTNMGYFNPKFVYVNNSSYAYYCAKNGSSFNPAFTAKDELVLNIVGVRNGAMTAHLKMPLITRGQFLNQWIGLSLENLGTVDKVLFYMDSNVKNEYGLTVPAYFCMTNFGYTLPQSANN